MSLYHLAHILKKILQMQMKKKSSIVPEYFKIPGYLKLNFGLSTLSDVDASMKIDALSSRSFDLLLFKTDVLE